MIKERVLFGLLFILMAGFAYYTVVDWGMLNTFLGGGLVVGLLMGGVAYLIFSFETPEYLERVTKRKPGKK